MGYGKKGKILDFYYYRMKLINTFKAQWKSFGLWEKRIVVFSCVRVILAIILMCASFGTAPDRPTGTLLQAYEGDQDPSVTEPSCNCEEDTCVAKITFIPTELVERIEKIVPDATADSTWLYSMQVNSTWYSFFNENPISYLAMDTYVPLSLIPMVISGSLDLYNMWFPAVKKLRTLPVLIGKRTYLCSFVPVHYLRILLSCLEAHRYR